MATTSARGARLLRVAAHAASAAAPPKPPFPVLLFGSRCAVGLSVLSLSRFEAPALAAPPATAAASRQ
eukprot:358092-Chlamydomonas_euryale.AAC.2